MTMIVSEVYEQAVKAAVFAALTTQCGISDPHENVLIQDCLAQRYQLAMMIAENFHGHAVPWNLEKIVEGAPEHSTAGELIAQICKMAERYER